MLTLEELSARCGMAPDAVDKIERGESPDVSLLENSKLSDELGLKVQDIFSKSGI